jgi:hypothetical protein
MVEAIFPATALWIHTPLWALIDANTMALDDIAAVIGTARPHLAKHVKSPSKTLSKPMTVDSLWRQGDLAALCTLLAIVRHAEITGDLAEYVEASWAALNLSIFVSSTSALSVVRGEFLDALWDRFFSELQSLPSPLPKGWSWEQSHLGLKLMLDEAARRRAQFPGPRALAQLAFWVTRQHPLFVIPAPLCPASVLDQYEMQLSSGKLYAASSMNFIKQVHFEILRSPLRSQKELTKQMADAERLFVAGCQQRVLPGGATQKPACYYQ